MAAENRAQTAEQVTKYSTISKMYRMEKWETEQGRPKGLNKKIDKKKWRIKGKKFKKCHTNTQTAQPHSRLRLITALWLVLYIHQGPFLINSNSLNINLIALVNSFHCSHPTILLSLLFSQKIIFNFSFCLSVAFSNARVLMALFSDFR